jgi:hypothetical protein
MNIKDIQVCNTWMLGEKAKLLFLYLKLSQI